MCDVSLKGLAKRSQSAKLGPPTKTRPLKDHFKTYHHPPFHYHTVIIIKTLTVLALSQPSNANEATRWCLCPQMRHPDRRILSRCHLETRETRNLNLEWKQETNESETRN